MTVTDAHGRIAYRLFDRVLWSSRPVPLLQQVPAVGRGAAPTPRDVVVEYLVAPVSDAPRRAITIGHPRGYRVFGTQRGYVFESAAGGWTAAIEPTGRRVDVHLPPEVLSDASTSRSIADDLTTAILTRLPALWGAVPVHAAALLGPTGLVLLCGSSGAGKSTISHLLARLEGWTLVDDDTVALRVPGVDAEGAPDEGVEVVGLGSLPRLRADAAQALGVAGRPLPGFADGKVAVDTARAPAVRNTPIAAVFHLRPQGSTGAGQPASDGPPGPEPGARVRIARLRSAEALRLLGKAAFSVDLRDREWLALRFRTTRQCAIHPTYAVDYQRGLIAPQEFAAAVSDAVGAGARPR